MKRATSELGGVTHAFSVRPQWAYLIIQGNRKHGKKDVENRALPTRFRERVAVHASITLSGRDKAAAAEHLVPLEALQPGMVIGTVEIYDCVRNSKSKWAARGFYHWLLRKPRPLKRARRMKGWLGVYPVKGRFY